MKDTVVDKSKLTELEYLLNEEFKLTSKTGSYCHSSILCCNNKQHHGLLACRLDEADNEYLILLSYLEETIIHNDNEYNLGSQRRSYGFNFSGVRYIEDIYNSMYPIIKFVAGPVRLRKEILLSNHSQHLFIRYTLLEVDRPVKLRLKPFLAFRKPYELNSAFPNIADPLLYIDNGFQTKLHRNYPLLSIQVSKISEIIMHPEWYYNFTYTDSNSDINLVEDLYVPGALEVKVFPEESVIVSIGIKEVDTESLNYNFNKELYGTLSNSFVKNM